MTARIRVGRFDYRGWYGEPAHSWIWDCTECNGGYMSRWVGYSHPEALAAGLAHLAKKHPEVVWAAGGRVYEAACGVRRDECGKAECTCQARVGAAESRSGGRVASVDPDDAGGRYSSVQRCEHCGHPVSEHYVERLKADLHEARRHTDQAWERVEYWRDSELPAARAEADLLRAQVAAVEKLADEYRMFWGFNVSAYDAEKQLRAALNDTAGGGDDE